MKQHVLKIIHTGRTMYLYRMDDIDIEHNFYGTQINGNVTDESRKRIEDLSKRHRTYIKFSDDLPIIYITNERIPELSMKEKFHLAMMRIEELGEEVMAEHDELITFYELFPAFLRRWINCEMSINEMTRTTPEYMEGRIDEVLKYIDDHNLGGE